MGEEIQQDDVQEVKIDIPKIQSNIQAIAFIFQGFTYLHKNNLKTMLVIYGVTSFVMYNVMNNWDMFKGFLGRFGL